MPKTEKERLDITWKGCRYAFRATSGATARIIKRASWSDIVSGRLSAEYGTPENLAKFAGIVNVSPDLLVRQVVEELGSTSDASLPEPSRSRRKRSDHIPEITPASMALKAVRSTWLAVDDERTVTKFYEITGVTQAYISMIINGKREPRLSLIESWAIKAGLEIRKRPGEFEVIDSSSGQAAKFAVSGEFWE